MNSPTIVHVDGVDHVTAADAAAIRGCTSTHIVHLARRGAIGPGIRIGGSRFYRLADIRLADIEALADRRRTFPDDVAVARYTERSRRGATAQGRARTELTHLHQAEYHELYARHKAEVDAERGPLPGDEVTT